MTSRDRRDAALVLCLPTGELLGETTVFEVPSPYPQEAGPLVDAARAGLGIEVTMLRLLDIEHRAGDEADLVRYLAEVAAPPAIALSSIGTAAVANEPHRMPWARPGGPARQLDWARSELEAAGIAPTAPPRQVRSWNLSSLWSLPTTHGTHWLKAVPPFFAHEGAVIERMSRHPVPRALAHADGMLLLEEIPGDDLYESTLEQACAMVDLLVAMQLDTVGRLDELFAIGLPDWRLPALVTPSRRLLDAWGPQLDSPDRAAVAELVDALDTRAARLEDCGLPDTLVHGDFHGGNVRGSGLELTLLDWGDSGVGHPLLDVAAFTERMPPADAEAVLRHWVEAWNTAVPGSDAARAATLIAPVAALRQAIVYQGFLDRIEHDERVYHAEDPPIWLRRAAEAFRAS
ncbi:phosphotransferase family protein [Agromyces sp. NPDC056965]|uniref:phosphotransferase family protein n=1 Tax=Agromyces sp. NPDC056965 TaxID=3345983 RepID=UPI00363C4EC1